MADTVAEGRVVLRVDENVRAELAKAEAAFDRTMAKLDGKEAELRLNADTKEFYAKFRKAQEDLDRWEHEKATAELDVDSRRANAGIANAKRRLQEYEKQNVKVVNRINNLDRDRAKAIDDLASKREAGERRISRAAEDAASRSAKAAEREAARREAASNRVAKAAEQQAQRAARAAEQQAAREQRAADRTAQAAERAAARQVAAQEKIRGQTARLERQYINLSERRSRLEKAQSRVFMPESDRQKIGIDIRGVDEQIAEVKAKLATIGHPAPEVDVHINTDNRGAEALGKWVTALSDTTVRLGPFTTTIAGAVRGLAVLGPVIMSIVGSLGALAAAVGAAGAAAGGIGLAAFGAFGLVLGSTAGLLPGLLSDFKNLTTLQNSAHKAVLKYGEGSKQAQAAQKQLDTALKQTDPSTRAAVKGFGQLHDAWFKLAQQSRKPFMNTINEGVKTGQQLIHDFGGEVTQSFALVAHGAQVAFKALRGPEAEGIIQTLFDNGQKALPAFGRGLANLAASAGRVAAAFSRMLPSLGGGFERWTQRFSNFTKDTSKLNSFVDKTVTSLRALGHLAQSTGGFLTAFFGPGVGPGIDLIDRMANGIDKITASIRRNPRGLSDFFGNSVDTLGRLYGVLQPLAALFVEWATMMRPFSNIILSVTGAVASLIDTLAGFGPTRGLLTAAFGVFLAGSIVAKIRGVTQAVQSLIAAIGQLGAKQIALRTGSALTGGALSNLGASAAGAARQTEQAAARRVEQGAARGAEQRLASGLIIPAGAVSNTERAAGAAEKLGGAMSRGSRAAGLLKGGLTGVGAILGIANPWFGAAALAATAAGAAFLYFKHKSDEVKQAVADAANALSKSSGAYEQTANSQADLDSAYQRSKLSVRAARDELAHAKKGTDEYRSAQLDLSDAIRQQSQLRTQVITTDRQQIQSSQKQIDQAHALTRAWDKQHGDRIAQLKYDISWEKKHFGELSINGQYELRELRKLEGQRKILTDAATAAIQRQQIAQVNNARAMHGFLPLLGQAERQVGQFAQAAGKINAQKIALNFGDPGQAGRVAQAAGNAIRNGVPKSVATRIAVSTGDAEQAIRRLQQAKITPKRLQIVASGGKEALSMIQQLTGRKVPKKDVNIVEKGGVAALGMLQKLLGVKLPTKSLPVTEKGSANVLGKLASINGVKLNSKTFQTIMRDLASGKLNAVLGLINSIPASRSSTVTVTTVHNNVFRETHLVGGATKQLMGGATGGIFPFAGGGRMGGGSRRLAGDVYTPLSLTSTISRAFDVASRNTVKKATGQKVSQPQLLVGEKHQTEFVVTTDPAYRKRNRGILATAAHRLGMNVVPAASGYNPLGVNTKTGYTPSFNVPKAPAGPGKKPKMTKRGLVSNFNKKKYNKALKSGRSWSNYITTLETRQTDLEREISIRESQVEEPTELLVEVGRIKDPQGNDLGPQMAPNTPQIEAYKAQLSAVMQAMVALIATIQEIIRAIPQALKAIDIEDAFRATNQDNLERAIHHEKQVIANHKKGKQSKADKAAVSRWTGYLNRDEKRLDSEKQERKNLKDDKKTLADNLKEAGFDLREANIAYGTTNADYSGIDGKASTEAAQQNTSTSGTGGGGAGGSGAGTTATLAQQTGAADTERANILKQFGSNMTAISSAIVRGVGGAVGGGVQGNPSALNPNAGVGTVDRAAAGALSGAVGGTGGATGGALTQAFAGGAAAAQILGAAGAGGASAALSGGGSTVTTTNIVNNFAAPPPDSHTWVKGVEFEIGASV